MKLTCPVSICQADNDFNAEVCKRCGLPLRGFAKMSIYPAHLFNKGLSEARANRITHARDLFAAVVYWCPMDCEAHNALAMTCFALEDYIEAQCQWEMVLKQSPANTLAAQGLAAIDSEKKLEEKGKGVSRKNKKNKKNKRNRNK